MNGRLLNNICLLIIAVCCSLPAAAQDRPIGYWRGHLPYNNAIGVATDGQTVYAISEKGFFSYDPIGGQISTYSKVEGMSDVGMAKIGYDATTETVVLAYTNSNIDLFRDNSFYNIPFLKNKPASGSKAVNDIYTDKGKAYLSTGLGIVVLNLETKKVAESYVFTISSQTIPINAFTGDEVYFYAATPRGLYRANRNSPNLQAFSVWTALDTNRTYTDLATVASKVYVTGGDSLFAVNNTAIEFVINAAGSTATHIDGGAQHLYFSIFYGSQFYSQVKKITASGAVTDSFNRGLLGDVRAAAELANGALWVADAYYDYGLSRLTGYNQKEQMIPQGPYSPTTFDILPYNKEVWLAHGAYDDKFIRKGNVGGMSHFKEEKWTNYRERNTPAFANVSDIVHLSKDPADGTIYGGTLETGLVFVKPEGGNTYTPGFIGAGILETKINEPQTVPATSTAFDQGGNLWVTQNIAANELAVRTRSGDWYHYTTPFTGGFAHGAAGLLVDDNNQKWYFGPQGRGVIVYNDNNTPETGNDDTYAQFRKGTGAGNLPSDFVYSIAKDKDGSIWVGTDNGIGIISCGYNATQSPCDAELRVVQYDQFPGLLFAEQRVQTIAVDGANRKWIGTANGVWLVSPDANRIIQRFTVTNSPLPSNAIQKIAVDPVTGDVYIGTDEGLVSFRYTATEGTPTNTDVITYPNPVPSGYSGTIAIRGLATDADVRITDIAGQLVHRTKALGGQAVWSGLDYTGHRPQSGVYLIFVTNKDGSQTAAGKMIFLN
jgi:hypothetical protein